MNNYTKEEIKRLLFILYPTYEQHPNEFDRDLVNKLREDLTYLEHQEAHTSMTFNNMMGNPMKGLNEL